MNSASISLETIKLQLIQNRDTGKLKGDAPQLSKEAVKYLIKALEYADAPFSNEIENVLTKAGAETIPELLKGLSSSHNNVKSTCAMVLVRLGGFAVEPLKQFYVRNANRANVNWVAEFILGELGEPLPLVELEPALVSLSKVG